MAEVIGLAEDVAILEDVGLIQVLEHKVVHEDVEEVECKYRSWTMVVIVTVRIPRVAAVALPLEALQVLAVLYVYNQQIVYGWHVTAANTGSMLTAPTLIHYPLTTWKALTGYVMIVHEVALKPFTLKLNNSSNFFYYSNVTSVSSSQHV